MYKVLDVREVSKCSAGRVNNDCYGHGGNLTIKETTYVVVIAEDEEHSRKRFEFYPGYRGEFLGDGIYYGYQGEFKFLVPGDTFEIEEAANTWPNVKLIKEN